MWVFRGRFAPGKREKKKTGERWPCAGGLGSPAGSRTNVELFPGCQDFLLLAFWTYIPHIFLDLFWRCLVIVREVFSDEYFSWHYTFFECYSIFLADGS